MPSIQAQRLTAFVRNIYEAIGVAPEKAAIVATEQVEANLAGHDSHGVLRTIDYVAWIKRGHIVPDAEMEIVRETAATAVIDGHWGFGFVCTRKATELVIAKARATGVAAATVRRQSHVGRLSPYGRQMAENGLIGMVTADSGMAPKYVVPFGGRKGRLGTNPISISAPSQRHGIVALDMATSTVAMGKIHVAAARGESIPTGWLLDADGAPTTDPSSYKRGAVLLPLGADQGHKGYGLSFMIEVLSGLLTGIGYGVDPNGQHNDGVFLAAFDVGHFIDLAKFESEMSSFIDEVKSTPLAQGHQEIYFPGEMERRVAEQRSRDGISIDDDTWKRLNDLAREVGVPSI